MAWMVNVKAVLISMGVLFMGLAMKVSVPFALGFLRSHVPVMWSSFLTLLRPPYLYVIINCIIITILASSRFHHDDHHDRVDDKPAPTYVSGPDSDGYEDKIVTSEEFHDQVWPIVLYEQREEKEEEAAFGEAHHDHDVAAAEPVDKYEIDYHGYEADHEILDSRSQPSVETPPPRRIESPEIFSLPLEKSLVSASFGHRKPVKPIPEGGSGSSSSLEVSKPKRHETMENTWKAITEGRSLPLSRHMKKCETWENHGRHFNVGCDEIEPYSTPPLVKKSETFKDRTNQQTSAHHNVTYSWPGSNSNNKLRKEPSLSLDELNKRAEAFIQKFNEEMRLQRQESLNQLMEMINRGSH